MWALVFDLGRAKGKGSSGDSFIHSCVSTVTGGKKADVRVRVCECVCVHVGIPKRERQEAGKTAEG